MSGIYIASKAAHGPRWRTLRDLGIPIISTWIDEAEKGATSDWSDLWSRCVSEAASADVLVLYRVAGEELKGAWVEAGAALAAGKPVVAFGCEDFSVRHHPLFKCFRNFEDALNAAIAEVSRLDRTAPAQPEGGGQ